MKHNFIRFFPELNLVLFFNGTVKWWDRWVVILCISKLNEFLFLRIYFFVCLFVYDLTQVFSHAMHAYIWILSIWERKFPSPLTLTLSACRRRKRRRRHRRLLLSIALFQCFFHFNITFFPLHTLSYFEHVAP